MNKLGVAIIGCGSIHRVHADAVVNSELGHMVCVVDIQDDRAQASAQDYHCQWHTDFNEVIKDDAVDVVHICTPHYLHTEMAVKALMAGKHVLVEKPVVRHIDEIKQVIKAREESGRCIGVCFQNRFNTTSQKAKEIIDSGTVGAVKGIKGIVTWYRDEDYYTASGWRGKFATEGGGVLINQSIHTIDLIQWLAGGVEAVKGGVSTQLLGKVIEVEDTAHATLFFRNGARGVFFATNCYTSNSPVEIEIDCEKARIRLYQGKLFIEQNGNVSCIADDNGGETIYKSYWGKSHAVLIENFYRGILNGDPGCIISAEEAVESVRIIDGIYKSASTGNLIHI
ncbi:MAG: Gfo/Idh/MocA family oxidoreductase [Clostridiales bacterium]|jgi:UDP-N-acetyl-2-amino-2-deoxyglucuronate dehydrogenase|nr:Gfo/Idh/MocA family oxidoreductase [Clostridiales bacterium]